MSFNEEKMLPPQEETYSCPDGKIYTKQEIRGGSVDDCIPNHSNRLFSTEDPLKSIIPKCYAEVRETTVNINNLHEETLIYIFYNCPGDESQIRAYEILVGEKGYFYHVKMGVFVGFDCEKKVDNVKRKIWYFDNVKWVKEEMVVVFDNEFVDNLRN